MEIKVTKPFCDKYNLTRLYTPGEVVDFEQKRAEDIVNRGLGEYAKKEKPAEKPKTDAEPAKVVADEVKPADVAVEKKKTGRKPKTTK